MTVNINKLEKRIMKEKKEFIRHIKDVSSLILYNFNKPIKTKKYKDTEYVYYHCNFITLDKEQIVIGKHIVMMPTKSLWLQLNKILKDKNMLKTKDIDMTIKKINNFRYDITIHTE